MRWIAVIFLAGLVALPAWAQIGLTTPIGSATVADFLKGCAVDRNGCQLTIGSALLDKIDVANGPAEVCPPTGADLGGPVTDWIRQHPGTQGMPAEDAIFQALKALYPCGAGR